VSEVINAGKCSLLSLTGNGTVAEAIPNLADGVKYKENLMKRIVWCALILLGWSTFAFAQKANFSADVMGAHLNYGRGCAACHAPHSGAAGNGSSKSADRAAGDLALWGEDVTGLYGKTIVTGGGKFTEVLPTSMSAATPDVAGMLTCLSCHDGNYASTSMMQNRVYETLPPTYGTHNSIPTLLGLSGSTLGNYLNQHPVGLSAAINCGGADGWDCSQGEGVITMTGAKSSLFVRNYGFFVKPGNYNNTAVVVCTTCHDPHLMNVFTVAPGSKSGLPPGTYKTMFFLRGPYNPASSTVGANTTAQFCRQCHAAESNEANGSTAATIL